LYIAILTFNKGTQFIIINSNSNRYDRYIYTRIRHCWKWE